jgi:hypothetical protein
MRRFVKRQRADEDDEGDEQFGEIEAGQNSEA